MQLLQIGDEKEIMYFRGKSDKDRKEWMEAFRIGTHTHMKMKISCMWYKLTPFIQLSVTTKCMTGTTLGHMVRSTTTRGAAAMKK